MTGYLCSWRRRVRDGDGGGGGGGGRGSRVGGREGVGGSLHVIATKPFCPQRRGKKPRFQKTANKLCSPHKRRSVCALLAHPFKYIQKRDRERERECEAMNVAAGHTGQCSRCRFKTCHKTVHTIGKNVRVWGNNFALWKAQESPLVSSAASCVAPPGSERH